MRNSQSLFAIILAFNIFVLIYGRSETSKGRLRFYGLHQDFERFLEPLLIERRVGTSGHRAAREHIVSTLKESGWTVSVESHTQDTVIGPQTFTNIRAKLGWFACPRQDIFLACHYDSKLMDHVFIGATDSAVPCAMLLSIASNLNGSLLQSSFRNASKVGIQLVFFDGEEAFASWSENDSLYGSRKLAENMASRRVCGSQRELDTMRGLILLDLIGTSDTMFVNHYPELTGRDYKQLQAIEDQLYLDFPRRSSGTRIFTDNYHGRIADDHIPFLRKGVRVLHLISCPFPSVWHTASDDRTALDFKKIQDLLDILTVFLAKTYKL